MGFEQNGKGANFVRPIVILKKITNQMFLGIPLSSQLKKGDWFFEFEFDSKDKSSDSTMMKSRMNNSLSMT